MGYRRDSLLLHHGSRAQQSSGRHKEYIAILSPSHIAEYLAAQHRRATSAARAAGMHILALVKDHHSAVTVPIIYIYASLSEQIAQQARADSPEIARKNAVIVTRTRARILKETIYGVRRSRC